MLKSKDIIEGNEKDSQFDNVDDVKDVIEVDETKIEDINDKSKEVQQVKSDKDIFKSITKKITPKKC